MRDLAEARVAIEARRDLVDRATRERERFRRLHPLPPGTQFQRVVARCSEAHFKGRVPKLAEAFVTSPGVLLFISKIRWLPSDQLTLRPWLREHLEGAGLGGAAYDLCRSSDEFLTDMLERHDAWENGVEPSGERWLAGAPSKIVLSMVTTSEMDPAIGLWTRCADHPEAAMKLRAQDLIAATRSNRSVPQG